MRRSFLVTSIIFSKDRPLQLDLCLSSIKKNFQDTNEIIVIEKYSDEYRKSLNTLKSEHPEVKVYPQSRCIYKDIKDCSLLSKNNYICFFTDDDIFYCKLGSINFDGVFAIPDVCSFSLRLGYNISKRFLFGKEILDIPILYNDIGGLLFISKTDHKYGSYWGYSESVDGHVFRSEQIIERFSELEYLNKRKDIGQTPNNVETNMQRYWCLCGNTIACPHHSVVVNSPNNRVSDSHKENMSGEHFDFSEKDCLKEYESGKRIDLNRLDLLNIQCPHQEIDIMKGLV